MSFIKGFWVTIIILTLNGQQDIQRTAWAGSGAERGNKPPPADASPITSLSFRPQQADWTQQENAFWTAEYKKRFLQRPQSTHTGLWMAGSGEMWARGCAERWLHRSHSSPAPAPTQRQQLQFSLRLPRRQKLKTRFHWSTAWISWIPLLSTFSAFPGVNTVKRGRKGMGGGHIQGNNCMPPLRSWLSEKILQRHLQQGSNMRKDYSWSEENKYMLNIFLWRKESNRQRPRNSNIMRYD